MKGIVCGALLTLTVTMAAAAEDQSSANYMLPYCALTADASLESKAFHAGICLGVSRSAMETFAVLKGAGYKGWLCADIPNNINNEQALSVIVKYAGQHPERTHVTLYMLSLEALMSTWPCKT